MEIEKTQGLIAATHTPMSADGSINPALVEKQAELLARNGVLGAFICGTTGEGVSLTVEERMQMADHWAAVAKKPLRVIVHVGHTSIKDSRALAAHAQKTGAWGIGSCAPFFFKPAGVDDLVAFCAEVAAAAPGLPFYYYHIPSVTGVDVRMADFLPTAGAKIPTLAGVKFTSSDFMDLGLSLRVEGGRYDLLSGWDEMMICALAMGARGSVGSTFNFAAPLYLELREAFKAGDLATARECQHKSISLVECFKHKRPSPLAYAKAIMRTIGLDAGPVRLPLVNLTEEQHKGLRSELERIGFFEFCCK